MQYNAQLMKTGKSISQFEKAIKKDYGKYCRAIGANGGRFINSNQKVI